MNKATFKFCANCGEKAPRSKRLCNSDRCGPHSRQERRAGRKSIWREPTAEEIAQNKERSARWERMLEEME